MNNTYVVVGTNDYTTVTIYREDDSIKISMDWDIAMSENIDAIITKAVQHIDVDTQWDS